MPLPEPVAQDHFGLDDAQVGSHGESAPAVRRRAEDGEKVRGDTIRKDLDRGAIAGQVGAGILPASQVGKVRLSSRQSCRDVSEKREPDVSRSIISRCGSGKLSGRSSTESTIVKMAVLPPIPIASVARTTIVKMGVRRSWRNA